MNSEIERAVGALLEVLRHEVRKELIREIANGPVARASAVKTAPRRRVQRVASEGVSDAAILARLPGQGTAIARDLGVPKHRVQVALRRLKALGFVRKEGATVNALWRRVEPK